MRFIMSLKPAEMGVVLLFAGVTLLIMGQETRAKGYISGLLGSDHILGPELVRTLIFGLTFFSNFFRSVFFQYLRGQYLAIAIIGFLVVGLVVEVIGNIIIINKTQDAGRDRQGLLDTGKDLIIILLLAGIILKQNPSALF